MNTKHKVIIRRCDDYDPDRIATIIKEGMDELGVTPSGNILLKPNTVIAHREMFPNAFTRKEFIDGVLAATKERAKDVKKIVLGERSGITLPTRYSFKEAGYLELVRKHKIKACYFDEVRQVPVEIKAEGRLRNTLYIPRPIVDCDFLINLPKFKAHPWTRLTLSLKNFIGIQDDRHRLVDHNSFLEHKIADLQSVIQPKFIAIDAIEAGQKMMLTPTPFPMGAIVMGTNSCAVDTVGCHMVHVDPSDLIHLKLAAQRGFGPMTLEEIDVSGDYPLEEVRKRTVDFEFLLDRVDNYFGGDGNLRCTVGTFPEKHSPNYCWGGCPGALQEAMHIIKACQPDVLQEMKKVRYVVGKVEGPLDLEEDERVIFMGDCTSWEGDIDGEHVKIESRYKTSNEVDESKTKSNDMLLKNIRTLWNGFKIRKSRYARARGCTVSVADHVHYISFLGKVPNVNFDSRVFAPLNVSYWQMRAKRLFSG
ncbi:MAG: DUF362 domain-containing protein [Deltaproteobacteria bacterium]|nr:DUF362 domain-containing protein [Deltaproteobacteria bacterium]